jgi:hypothetical protein
MFPTLAPPSHHSQIALERVLFKNTGPVKGNVQMGVTATCEVPTGDIVVGGGDGSLQVLRTVPEPSSTNPKLLRKMPALASTKVEGAITSIALADVNARGFTLFVGTAMCNIYKVRVHGWAGGGGRTQRVLRPPAPAEE